MITTSATINHGRRDKALAEEEFAKIRYLISHAMDLQRRLSLAEKTAPLLSEMLSRDNGLVKSVSGTYEGHAFETLRMQLFRILIVDLYAAIFDTSSESGSLRKLIKLLKDEKTLECLRDYQCDTSFYDITVKKIDFATHGTDVTFEEIDLTGDDIASAKEEFLRRKKQEQIDHFEERWRGINDGSLILDSVAFKRIAWARNKLGAHFDKNGEAGLVAFDEAPKDRDGSALDGGTLTWGEPIELLHAVKGYAYDVFLFITSTYWGEGFEKKHQFFAQSFWERFKMGKSNLEPPKL